MTGMPLLDIILNIHCFTAHFDDRLKLIMIIKDLFKNCNSFKKLLFEHSNLILSVLLGKYDKKCHIFVNYALQNKNGKNVDDEKLENRDEFLAGIIGELIRLFAKSTTLSANFCNFQYLEHLAILM